MIAGWIFCSLFMVCTKDGNFQPAMLLYRSVGVFFEKMLIFVGKVSQPISDILEELERSYGVDCCQVCHQENHRVINIYIYLHTERDCL